MKSGLSKDIRAIIAAALVTDFTDTSIGSKLHLFQNDIVPGPLVLVGDFTECDFAGYAAKTAITTWVTFNDAPTGDQIVQNSTLELFAAGAITAPQFAYGWYATDNAGTELLAWGRFDDPYQFLANGDKLEVNQKVRVLLNTGQTN